MRGAGIFLIFTGVALIVFGDRKLALNEEKIGKIFFPPEKTGLKSKTWKWALGVLLILVGLNLLLVKVLSNPF